MAMGLRQNPIEGERKSKNREKLTLNFSPQHSKREIKKIKTLEKFVEEALAP